MLELSVGVCQGGTATSFLQGKEIARKLVFHSLSDLLIPWEELEALL
jgi:hypothetical protein